MFHEFVAIHSYQTFVFSKKPTSTNPRHHQQLVLKPCEMELQGGWSLPADLSDQKKKTDGETLRIPRKDWESLGNIREDSGNHHPPLRILLANLGKVGG